MLLILNPINKHYGNKKNDDLKKIWTGCPKIVDSLPVNKSH